MTWNIFRHLSRRRREGRKELAAAKEIRAESERKRAHEERTIVRPLREMREQNHLTEELVRIIREGGHPS